MAVVGLSSVSMHRPSSSSNAFRRLGGTLGASGGCSPFAATSNARLLKLSSELESRCIDTRLGAVQEFGKAVASQDMALAVAGHLKALGRRLRDRDSNVRTACLGVMRSLAECGQALRLGPWTSDIVKCLKDDDQVVQRKAAALCRVIAEEGAAGFLAGHVSSLLDCFEKGLVTPLDALSAMAEAGEAKAVSHGVCRLAQALDDRSSRIRMASCQAIASMVRCGGGDMLRSLSLLEAVDGSCGPSSKRPLLESLVALVRDDADREVRVAAVRALRTIADTDASSAAVLRDTLSGPLFIEMYRRLGPHATDIQDQLAAILGVETRTLSASIFGGSVNDEEAESDEESDQQRLCVICQRGRLCVTGVICQQGLCKHQKSQILRCGHRFHSSCIGDWLKYKQQMKHAITCPICRLEVNAPAGRPIFAGVGVQDPRSPLAQAAATRTIVPSGPSPRGLTGGSPPSSARLGVFSDPAGTTSSVARPAAMIGRALARPPTGELRSGASSVAPLQAAARQTLQEPRNLS